MPARRIVFKALAALFAYALLQTSVLAADQPAAKPDARALFLELTSNGKIADGQAKFDALRALADQGDPMAIAFVAAIAYGQNNEVAFDYLLKGFAAPPAFASEVHLIQGFQCNRGFNERAAAGKAGQILQAPDASAAAKQTALIVQGLLNQYGGGDFKASKLKALEYFQQAAAQGSALALALQGRIYEFDGGKEVPVDKVKAMALYKAAADKNDPHGLYLYGVLKKELEGDRKTWESALRKAIDVGAHEGAMAELGYDLVTRPGATKQQIDEGRTLVEWGYRLRSTYATLNMGLLAENGQLPNLDSPVGVSYMFYRRLAQLPCGAPDGPNAIVKLIPKLESAPAQVLDKLNPDGMFGIMTDLVEHFASVKTVREAVWAWAAVPHEANDDFVNYLAGSKSTLGAKLVLSAGYARMHYDSPAELQSPEHFADEFAGLFQKIAGAGEISLSDLSLTNRAVDDSLGANARLDAQSRSAYAAAIKQGLASANEQLHADFERRHAPPPPTPATPEQIAEARSCYDTSADLTRRRKAFDERAENFQQRRAALDAESNSIDNEKMLVDLQVGLNDSMSNMGFKNTDNGSARANVEHLNNRVRAYNQQNEQLNKVGARLDKDRDQLHDAFESYRDRCSGSFNSQAVQAVCGDTPSDSHNRWCAGFSD